MENNQDDISSQEELREAILNELRRYGEVTEESYFLLTKYDKENKILSIIYDFVADEKILYQAKKYRNGDIETQRVYIAKDMVDVLKKSTH